MFISPKILVLTDFSPSSDRASRLAAQLAARTDGTLHLLHVHSLGMTVDWTGMGASSALFHQFSETLLDDLNKLMELQLKRCSVQAKSKVILGADLIFDILEEQKNTGYDLIVVGDKGQSAIKAFMLGSLTRKICAASPVPVLVVKDDQQIYRISALLDGHHISEKVIHFSQIFARTLAARLEMISLSQNFPGLYGPNALEYTGQILNSIHEHSELCLQKLEQKLWRMVKDEEVLIKVIRTNEANLGEHLVEILHDEEAQLAILQRSHKNQFERFLLGSVTNSVLEGFRGNVLIV